MPQAWLYSRVSTVRQVDGLGLTRQAQERDKWLQAHSSLGLTVVQNYADLGMSARGKAQTEGKLSLILDAIESGKIPKGSYLIVDNLDRLSREELIDAHYMILGIIRAGIIIVTVSDGMVYDRSDRENTMFQLLISLVILARSSNESDKKSDDGLKNWRIKRETIGTSEKPYTTASPAWISYDKDKNTFILNNHAATVVRMYELAASGLGNALIVQTMIKEKYAPMATRRKDGGKWSTQYVKMVLNNRAVLGEFQPGIKNHGTDEKREIVGEPVPNYFPKVSENIQNLFDKVRIIRNERAEKMSKHANRRGDFTNLFSGLCRCAGCNGVMTVVNRPDRKNLSYLRCSARYVTKTCTDGDMYNYPKMEKIIFDQLENIIFPNIADDSKHDDIMLAARNKVIELKRRIANLVDEGEDIFKR